MEIITELHLSYNDNIQKALDFSGMGMPSQILSKGEHKLRIYSVDDNTITVPKNYSGPIPTGNYKERLLAGKPMALTDTTLLIQERFGNKLVTEVIPALLTGLNIEYQTNVNIRTDDIMCESSIYGMEFTVNGRKLVYVTGSLFHAYRQVAIQLTPKYRDLIKNVPGADLVVSLQELVPEDINIETLVDTLLAIIQETS